MNTSTFLEILKVAEKLKCNTRHSWTSSGRHESVAEHSWRLALMALLMRDEFPELDMNKVIHMCLIHDLGEAFTGDIPSFEKKEEDTQKEDEALGAISVLIVAVGTIIFLLSGTIKVYSFVSELNSVVILYLVAFQLLLAK